MVTCVSLGISSITELICTIGFRYAEPAGITDGFAPDVFAFQYGNHLYFALAYFLFALFMSISPRFPDLWMALWNLGMMYLMARADPAYFSTFSKVGPYALFFFVGNVMMATRLKLRIASHLDMERHRASYLSSWQSMLSKSPDSQEQLERLEGLVWKMEQSIPTGTMARQFNLRSDESWESQHELGKQWPNSGPQHASSLSFTESPRSGSGEAGNSFRLTAVSSSLLSVLMDSEDRVAEPWTVLSTAPSKRIVSKVGFERVMAAVVMTGSYVHDPMSPIKSMDQLWTQAMLVRGPLLTKVTAPLPHPSPDH